MRRFSTLTRDIPGIAPAVPVDVIGGPVDNAVVTVFAQWKMILRGFFADGVARAPEFGMPWMALGAS